MLYRSAVNKKALYQMLFVVPTLENWAGYWWPLQNHWGEGLGSFLETSAQGEIIWICQLSFAAWLPPIRGFWKDAQRCTFPCFGQGGQRGWNCKTWLALSTAVIQYTWAGSHQPSGNPKRYRTLQCISSATWATTSKSPFISTLAFWWSVQMIRVSDPGLRSPNNEVKLGGEDCCWHLHLSGPMDLPTMAQAYRGKLVCPADRFFSGAGHRLCNQLWQEDSKPHTAGTSRLLPSPT